MRRIGVVGAGTMGAGIAQVAVQAGLGVRLYDVAAAPLEAGLSRMRAGLDRLVERGRMTTAARDGALTLVSATTVLADFADVDFVVEAAPEVLELKRELFAELDRICGPEVVIATNTSSLSVTEIGALTRRHRWVVGMHFFNPVPLMKLVEVVRGAHTGDEAVRQTTALAERLGKTPVQAKDTPGFIVNRVARSFSGEALRIYGDNIAGIRQVDRVARLAAGFRMGPFELMDLVGMDVNYAVNRSVFEQFFAEPRFRPHPLQAQMVKANLLGRKTGAGWYRYENEQIVDGPRGSEYAGAPGTPVTGIHSVYVLGDPDVAALAAAAGYSLIADPGAADVVVSGSGLPEFGAERKPDTLLLVEASARTVTEMAAHTAVPAQVVGYAGVPTAADRHAMEVAVGLRTTERAWQRAALFFCSLGRDVEVIRDGPGLIAPRLIACLVNEAAYALMEGVATGADIDEAMRLGVNYPRGPLEWADAIGLNRILQILVGLHTHTGDDRYRPCPLLRQLATAGLRFTDQSSYSR